VAPVTLVTIRQLARLCRTGIPGAHEELDRVVRETAEFTSKLVDLAPGRISAENVIARLKESDASGRAERQRLARTRAQEFANRVGSDSQPLRDGSLQLPLEPFCAMVAAGGFAQVTFLEAARSRTVDLRTIRTLLRLSRGARLTIRLTDARLCVTHETLHGRGQLALVARPSASSDDPLTVRLPNRNHQVQLKRALQFLTEFNWLPPTFG
jgi:hypothetical protein